jgi:hypothetical protein
LLVVTRAYLESRRFLRIIVPLSGYKLKCLNAELKTISREESCGHIVRSNVSVLRTIEATQWPRSGLLNGRIKLIARPQSPILVAAPGGSSQLLYYNSHTPGSHAPRAPAAGLYDDRDKLQATALYFAVNALNKRAADWLAGAHAASGVPCPRTQACGHSG